MTPDAPIRILFVEDSEDDCFLIARHLRAAGLPSEHRRVETRDHFLDAIDSVEWDIILSDHSMPLFSSTHALETLRDRGLDIPIVIVSGTIGEEQAVRVMRAGARDYVLKHNMTRLAQVVTRELQEAQARRKYRALEAALRTSEDQLRHAQKMEAVGRLASGVAHDFNNLLTAILGFSGFALEQMADDDPLRRDLDQVVMAAQRATRLTAQLLAFSRQQPANPRVVDINETVRVITPMLARLLGKDIEIITSLASDMPTVLIDPGQLEQVLMNLAVNARDAMPNGGSLTLRSFAMRLDPATAPMYAVAPGNFAALEVRDTGQGMDDATRAHVFEPFFTTKGEGKGTGLGLSTVYGIVTQSSGGLSLETALGAGTAFTIVLPVASNGEATTDAAITPQEYHGTETIVVVEHDVVVASLIKIVLTSAGYTVLEGTTEDEAAARTAAAGGADLLITNLVVGNSTGRALARRLTADCPRLRLLYLTGHTAHNAMPDEMLLDPSVLIRKPFTPTQLLAAVRARLDASTS